MRMRLAAPADLDDALGCFAFLAGPEPDYARIYEGAWPTLMHKYGCPRASASISPSVAHTSTNGAVALLTQSFHPLVVKDGPRPSRVRPGVEGWEGPREGEMGKSVGREPTGPTWCWSGWS